MASVEMGLAVLDTARRTRGDPVGQGKPSDATGILSRRVADITAKPIHWLWPGRIARGRPSMIVGNPGLGKSQITASLAAIVTNGGQWPVDCTRSEPGEVAI